MRIVFLGYSYSTSICGDQAKGLSGEEEGCWHQCHLGRQSSMWLWGLEEAAKMPLRILGVTLTFLSCTHCNPPAHQGHLNRSHPLTSLLPNRHHPDLGPPASCLRAHGSPYLAFLPQPCPLHHLPPENLTLFCRHPIEEHGFCTLTVTPHVSLHVKRLLGPSLVK